MELSHFNTVGLLAIAMLNAFTAWMAWNSRKNIEKIEIATNSMKDALVAATDKAAHAAGREEGRAEGRLKQPSDHK